MSTAQQIADAIVNTLKADSALGGTVSRTYGILGRRQKWAAIVELRGCEKFPHQFGSLATRWTFDVLIYLHDTGNPVDVMNRVLEVTDRAVTALDGDPTLGGTVDRIESITVDRLPGEAVEVSGRVWIPILVRIEAVKY